MALLARQPAPENLALGPHQQLLTEDSPDPSVPPTRSAVDKRCGEMMKNAEDFAVMIRKQLKKEIVKIPKKVRPRRPNPATTDSTERYNHAIPRPTSVRPSPGTHARLSPRPPLANRSEACP